MLIEFDPLKNARNIHLRGIGLERFAEIDISSAISVEDTRRDYGERRLRVLGYIDGRLHAAVITPRGEKIRVISLRRANRREEWAYAEEHQAR